MVYIKKGIIGGGQRTQVWIVNQAPYKITITIGTTIGQVSTNMSLESQLDDIQIL